MKDGAVTVFLDERTGCADPGGGGAGGVFERRGEGERGDAAPVAFDGDEDGGDDVLVELGCEQGVEFVGVAEGDELEVDGSRHGDVAVLEVLSGGSDSGEGGGAGAVVVETKLAGEGLRCRDAVVDLHELDGSEAAAGRHERRRRDDRRRHGSGGRRGPSAVTLREEHGRGEDEGESEETPSHLYVGSSMDGHGERLEGDVFVGDALVGVVGC